MLCRDCIKQEIKPLQLEHKVFDEGIADQPVAQQLREQIVGAFSQLNSNEETQLVLDGALHDLLVHAANNLGQAREGQLDHS